MTEIIRDEVVDELLGNARTAEDLFGPEGLFKRLKRKGLIYSSPKVREMGAEIRETGKR